MDNTVCKKCGIAKNSIEEFDPTNCYHDFGEPAQEKEDVSHCKVCGKENSKDRCCQKEILEDIL